MRPTSALAVALCCASPVAAQQQDVPRDVVFGMLKSTSANADVRELTIGAPPRGFPRDLIPPGTLLAGWEMGGVEQFALAARVVVLRTPADPDSALESAEAHLARAGLHPPPNMRTMGGGGFVTSWGPPNTRLLCSDTSLVTLRSSSRTEGGSYLSVSVSDSRRSICGGRDERVAFVRSGQITLPTLTPPRGMRTIPSGGGGGSNHQESSARHFTDQSPKQLVEHYARQLAADGWTLGARLDGTGVSIVTATKTDREGRRQLGTLTAAILTDNERHLSYRVLSAAMDR